MRTFTIKYALAVFFVGCALSQPKPKATIPQPPPIPAPACLSNPVTLGTVTMTCTMIDNTESNGSGLGLTIPDAYLFQVRVVSIDPDVIGVRIGVTYLAPVYDAKGSAQLYTVWGSVGVSTGGTFVATPGFRYTFVLTAASVTGVMVQELKASSSQTF